MNSKLHFKYPFLILMLLMMLAGCGGMEKQDVEFPWSINIPELSVRLIVRDKIVELGQYPMCMIEVMNTSKQTILLRKDFALNGPAAYDENGNPTSQRRALEVKAGTEEKHYRIEPGQKISVKAVPNYQMEVPGKYILRFSIHPAWWGFDDVKNPGKLMPKDLGTGVAAVSNEVRISVYSGER